MSESRQTNEKKTHNKFVCFFFSVDIRAYAIVCARIMKEKNGNAFVCARVHSMHECVCLIFHYRFVALNPSRMRLMLFILFHFFWLQKNCLYYIAIWVRGKYTLITSDEPSFLFQKNKINVSCTRKHCASEMQTEKEERVNGQILHTRYDSMSACAVFAPRWYFAWNYV